MRSRVRNYHHHEGRGMVARPPALLLEPAYFILPLLRWPVGFSHSNPLNMTAMAALLAFVPPFLWAFVYGLMHEWLPANLGQAYLTWFAGLSLAAHLANWSWRFFGMERGAEIHSKEAGYSWLAWYLPVPAWLTELILVPGLIGLAGWCACATFSRSLGVWLMLTAFSLSLMASWEIRRRVAAGFAVSDGLVQGQTAGWRLQDHEGKARTQASGAASGPVFAEGISGPAMPPDAMSSRPGSDSLVPERMLWSLPRRERPRGSGGRGASARRRGPDGGGGGVFRQLLRWIGRRLSQPNQSPSPARSWQPEARNYAEPGE